MDSYFWYERWERAQDEDFERLLSELEREQFEDLREDDIGYIGGQKND